MFAQAFLDLCALHHKRTHVIGDLRHGVIAGLDLEGRLFVVRDGHILNRVNVAAISDTCATSTSATSTSATSTSTTSAWLNPGGDGLWPAPEGSRLGYLYATGAWSVPPAITNARYAVIASSASSAVVQADLDLINADGRGVPVRAERAIAITHAGADLVITCDESLTYRGPRPLTTAECLLAPWSLSQFDCGPDCETVFPDAGPACVWDLYAPSPTHRTLRDGLWHVRTDGSARFQLGLSADVPWIEFRRPDGLRVRRSANIPDDQPFIDIADRPAHVEPEARGCRFSIYSDASGFMEIEAAGGMPAVLLQGARLSVSVVTTFSTARHSVANPAANPAAIKEMS